MNRLLLTLSCSLLAWSAAPLSGQEIPLGLGDPRVVRLHHVADLVRSPQADGDHLGDAGVAAAADDHPWLEEQRALLADFVATFVEPPLADNEAVRMLGPEHLVVLGRPEQQAWVDRALLEQRAALGTQIGVEIRVLAVAKDAFAEHFAPLLDEADTWRPLQHVLADSEATRRFVGAVMADPRIDSVTAPRLVVLPLQRATVTVGEPLSYVRDYEIHRAGHRLMAEPVVDQVFDGIKVDTICGFVGAGAIGVVFDYQHFDVERPIPTFETDLAIGAGSVEIHLPAWQEVHLEQKLVMPKGGYAIVSAPDRDHYAVALVHTFVVR
ncbi:MAG: hypothetical protein AAF628_29680 [Planctomycetota bacterium]